MAPNKAMLQLGFPLLLVIFVLEAEGGVSTAATNGESPRHTELQLSNISGCPESCNCTLSNWTLSVRDCDHDPAKQLDPLLHDHLDIRRLSITDSRMVALPDVVCNMTSLITLNVSGNRLSDLPWRCLRRLDKLQDILARDNQIQILRNSTLYRFQSLTTVDFRYNMITEIEADVFSDVKSLPALRSVYLAHNRLTSLDPWVFGFMIVSVRNNQISRFTNRLGLRFPYGHRSSTGYLSLAYNKIRYISDMLHGWGIKDDPMQFNWLFGRGLHLDMRNNAFNCNCKDVNIFDMLTRYHTGRWFDELICSAPPSMFRRRISTVPLDQFVCNVTEKCPDGCHCIDTPSTANLTINCEHTRLTELPAQLPNLPTEDYSYHLFFSNNNLTTVNYRDYFPKTKTAVFSNNKIDAVSLQALQGLTQIQTLRLDGNNLARLPKNISTLCLQSVTSMTFHENPWMCDCHSIPMKHWFGKHIVAIAMPAGIICASPQTVAGFSLLGLPDDRFVCDNGGFRMPLTLTACLATAATVFSLFALVILFIRVKRVLVYRSFGLHPFDVDECPGEEMAFDCFVLYDSNDLEFAVQTIIPAIEGRRYRVCFPHIHFVAGQPIVDNLRRCINSSRRSVVYFTQAFIRNDVYLGELLSEFADASEKKGKRLILVTDGCLNMAELDANVLAFLRRYKPIQRNSREQWDRLFYSLPVYPLIEARVRGDRPRRQPANQNMQTIAVVPPDRTQNAVNGSSGNQAREDDDEPLLP